VKALAHAFVTTLPPGWTVSDVAFNLQRHPHGRSRRHDASRRPATPRHVWKLALELAIDFVVMYSSCTMIDTIGHLYLNINNVYMTLMMVAPMAVLMLVSMRAMFPRRSTNIAIAAGAAVLFVVSWWYARRRPWATGSSCDR
jgi:hypothetical protein